MEYATDDSMGMASSDGAVLGEIDIGNPADFDIEFDFPHGMPSLEPGPSRRGSGLPAATSTGHRHPFQMSAPEKQIHPPDSDEMSNSPRPDEAGSSRPETSERKRRNRGYMLDSEDEKVPQMNYELQQGYRILRELLSDANKSLNFPFIEAVDAEKLGLWDYYDRIESPMWLKKMKEKFLTCVYTSITEFVADFRMMLENCYRYNGPDHYVSKKGQKLEQVMEQKLSLLSRELREKTTLETTSGQAGVSGFLSSGIRRRGRVIQSHDSSALLNQLRREEAQREKDYRRQQILEKKQEKEQYYHDLIKWDVDIMGGEEGYAQLKAMSELPEIGLFIYLCQEPLRLWEVPQFELERSFYIPRESCTMQRVMTALLRTQSQRIRDEKKPLFTYRQWNYKLSARLAKWYKFVDEKQSTELASRELGINPTFFTILGRKRNPLEKKSFHDLTPYQRVWIVKCLCENNLEIQETLREAIECNPAIDQKDYNLGTDGDGNTYIHFPQFCGQDLRIYRQAPFKYPKWRKTTSAIELHVSSPRKSPAPSPRKPSPAAKKKLISDRPSQPTNSRQRPVVKPSTPDTSDDDIQSVSSYSSGAQSRAARALRREQLRGIQMVHSKRQLDSMLEKEQRIQDLLDGQESMDCTSPERSVSRSDNKANSEVQSDSCREDDRASVISIRSRDFENDEDTMSSLPESVSQDFSVGRVSETKTGDTDLLKELGVGRAKLTIDKADVANSDRTSLNSSASVSSGHCVRVSCDKGELSGSHSKSEADDRTALTQTNSEIIVGSDEASNVKVEHSGTSVLHSDAEMRIKSEPCDFDENSTVHSVEGDNRNVESHGPEVKESGSAEEKSVLENVSSVEFNAVKVKMEVETCDAAELAPTREEIQPSAFPGENSEGRSVEFNADAAKVKMEVETSEGELCRFQEENVDFATDSERITSAGNGNEMEVAESSVKMEDGDSMGTDEDDIKFIGERKASDDRDVMIIEKPEEEEVEIVVPDVREFELIGDSVEQLRMLIKQFEEPDVITIRKGKKETQIKPPPRKKCVADLHGRLLFLLKELEPWETKLIQANRKMRERVKREFDEYVEPEEPEEIVIEDSTTSDSDDSNDSDSDSDTDTSTTTSDKNQRVKRRKIDNNTSDGDSTDVSSRGRQRTRRKIPDNAAEVYESTITRKKATKKSVASSSEPKPSAVQTAIQNLRLPPNHVLIKTSQGYSIVNSTLLQNRQFCAALNPTIVRTQSVTTVAPAVVSSSGKSVLLRQLNLPVATEAIKVEPSLQPTPSLQTQAVVSSVVPNPVKMIQEKQVVQTVVMPVSTRAPDSKPPPQVVHYNTIASMPPHVIQELIQKQNLQLKLSQASTPKISVSKPSAVVETHVDKNVKPVLPASTSDQTTITSVLSLSSVTQPITTENWNTLIKANPGLLKLVSTPQKTAKYSSNVTVKSLLETRATQQKLPKTETSATGPLSIVVSEEDVPMSEPSVVSGPETSLLDEMVKSVLSPVKTTLPTVQIKIPSPKTLPVISQHDVTSTTRAMKAPIPTAVPPLGSDLKPQNSSSAIQIPNLPTNLFTTASAVSTVNLTSQTNVGGKEPKVVLKVVPHSIMTSQGLMEGYATQQGLFIPKEMLNTQKLVCQGMPGGATRTLLQTKPVTSTTVSVGHYATSQVSPVLVQKTVTCTSPQPITPGSAHVTPQKLTASGLVVVSPPAVAESPKKPPEADGKFGNHSVVIQKRVRGRGGILTTAVSQPVMSPTVSSKVEFTQPGTSLMQTSSSDDTPALSAPASAASVQPRTETSASEVPSSSSVRQPTDADTALALQSLVQLSGFSFDGLSETIASIPASVAATRTVTVPTQQNVAQLPKTTEAPGVGLQQAGTLGPSQKMTNGQNVYTVKVTNPGTAVSQTEPKFVVNLPEFRHQNIIAPGQALIRTGQIVKQVPQGKTGNLAPQTFLRMQVPPVSQGVGQHVVLNARSQASAEVSQAGNILKVSGQRPRIVQAVSQNLQVPTSSIAYAAPVISTSLPQGPLATVSNQNIQGVPPSVAHTTASVPVGLSGQTRQSDPARQLTVPGGAQQKLILFNIGGKLVTPQGIPVTISQGVVKMLPKSSSATLASSQALTITSSTSNQAPTMIAGTQLATTLQEKPVQVKAQTLGQYTQAGQVQFAGAPLKSQPALRPVSIQVPQQAQVAQVLSTSVPNQPQNTLSLQQLPQQMQKKPQMIIQTSVAMPMLQQVPNAGVVKPLTESVRPDPGTGHRQIFLQPNTGVLKPSADAIRQGLGAAPRQILLQPNTVLKPSTEAVRQDMGTAPRQVLLQPNTGVLKPSGETVRQDVGTGPRQILLQPNTGVLKPSTEAVRQDLGTGPRQILLQPNTGVLKPSTEAVRQDSGTGQPQISVQLAQLAQCLQMQPQATLQALPQNPGIPGSGQQQAVIKIQQPVVQNPQQMVHVQQPMSTVFVQKQPGLVQEQPNVKLKNSENAPQLPNQTVQIQNPRTVLQIQQPTFLQIPPQQKIKSEPQQVLQIQGQPVQGPDVPGQPRIVKFKQLQQLMQEESVPHQQSAEMGARQEKETRSGS